MHKILSTALGILECVANGVSSTNTVRSGVQVGDGDSYIAMNYIVEHDNSGNVSSLLERLPGKII